MHRKYLRLKGCPRCGGDVLIDKAYEDIDEVCIQCGYRNYLNVTDETAKSRKLIKIAKGTRRKKAKQVA